MLTWNLAQIYGISQSGFEQIVNDAIAHFTVNSNDTITVQIDAGVYNIGGNGSHGIDLSDVSGGRLIFRGAGVDKTFLVFTENDQRMFHAANGSGFTAEDFTITRTGYHTVSQGIVTNKGIGFVDIDMDDNFPKPVGNFLDPNWGQGRYLRRYTCSQDPKVIFDGSNNAIVPFGLIDGNFVAPELLQGCEYRFYLNQSKRNLTDYKEGDLVGVRSKKQSEGDAFWFFNFDNIQLRRIRVVYDTRVLFRDGCDNVTIDSLEFPVGDAFGDSIPVMGSASGGVQIGQDSPTIVCTNFVVKNCYFDSLGDDCIGLFNCDNVRILNNTIRNSFGRNIYSNGEHQNVTIQGNEIINGDILGIEVDSNLNKIYLDQTCKDEIEEVEESVQVQKQIIAREVYRPKQKQFRSPIDEAFYNFIGVRGLCTKEFQCYADLPGLSLKKTAQIDEDGDVEDLICRLSDSAVESTISDFTNKLNSYFTFNSLIGEVEHLGVGSDYFDDFGDKFISFRVKKKKKDKFSFLQMDGFKVYSTVKTEKTFYYSIGMEDFEFKYKLRIGLNWIPLKIETQHDYFRVFFNTCGLRLGRRSTCYCNYECYSCEDRCAYIVSEQSKDALVWDSCPDWGFDVCVKCKCDKRAFAAYYKDELKEAIKYKFGINWVQYALNSDRGNRYTQNSKDQLERLLADWTTTKSNLTGENQLGEYDKKLLDAVRGIKNQVGNMNTMCISCNSINVVNELP